MPLPGSPAVPGAGGGSYSRLPGAPVTLGGIRSGRLPGVSDFGSGDPNFNPFGTKSAFELVTHRDKYIAQYTRELMRMGMDQGSAQASAEIAFQRTAQHLNRPSPFLKVLGKVLSAPAEVVSGFASGYLSKMPTHSNNPWDFIKSAPSQAVAGYHEAGTALHENKQFGDYMAAAHPDTPGWASFGASAVFDPVMYLSFGATAGSKLAARGALEFTARDAMRRANNIIAKDGMYFGTKYNDPIELMQAIREADGMPMDLPQALDQLRASGMEYKGTMRRLRSHTSSQGIIAPSPARVLGAYVLPTGVRGGRGIRFAGMEIPGSAAATNALRQRMQADISERLAKGNPLTSGLLVGFTTNSPLRAIGEDTLRVLALSEMRSFQTELQGAKMEAQKFAREAAKGGTGKFIPPKERFGALEEAPLINMMAVKGERALEPGDVVAISKPQGAHEVGMVMERNGDGTFQVRYESGYEGGVHGDQLTHLPDRNEMRAAPRPSKLTPAVQSLVHQVHDRVAKEIEMAKAVKYPERDTQELWAKISSQTDDPVEALGVFAFQNQVRVRSRQFVQRILENPLYARKIESKGAEHVVDRAIPEGYKPYYDQATRQHYAVLGEMHDALDNLVNPQFLDKSIKHVMDLLGMPQLYWKQFATSANPSFHVMNFLGAVWNNLYASVFSPANYVHALTAVYRSRMEEAAAAGAERHLGRSTVAPKGVFKSSEDILSLRKAAHAEYSEAKVRGATSDTASIFAEIKQGIERGKGPFIDEAPASVQARLESIYKRGPRESRKKYTLKQARRGAAVGMLATGNPVGVALLAPEAARAGRVLGTAIEDIVRLAPFMKAAHDPVLARYLDSFGPITVPGMHHPGFSKEVQVAMYDIGAMESKHFQFDYSDLTEFERKISKTWFPFYTFYRKNFVLQAQLIGQAPRGIAGAQSAMNYMNENGDVSNAMAQMLPEYFDQIGAFQVPVPQGVRKKLGLPSDQPLFLNPKLPFMSLNLMPPLWDVFRDTGQPTPQKVGQVLAPIIGSIGPLAPVPIPGAKIILEAMVGEQLGLNKTLDYQRASSNDFRNSWVPAPSWVGYLPGPVRDFMGIFPWGKTAKTDKGYLMQATGQYVLNQLATPFVTNLGQSIPVGGQDQGKSRADLVSWMTGVRLIPLDVMRMHRSWGYRMKSMLEARRNDLKDQGLELSPEDMQSLRMVRAQLKVIERSWDARQAALYGTP